MTAKPEDMETFLTHILDQVKKNRLISGRFNSSNKLIEFVPPEEMEAKLGGLEIGSGPTSDEELRAICDRVVRYSVKTCHPAFYNQLFHGVDEYGMAGGWLSDALNTNCHTYEVAPVFIVVEKAVIRYVLDKFGLSSEGDGIFSPGGSMSNMYGMMLARHKMFPEIKKLGLFNGLQGAGPLVAFTSDQSHYSMAKSAHWLGIGTDNVVSVLSDDHGRMRPEELDRVIKEAKEAGKRPFFVNATSGTTVIGAYDPIEEIAEVCKRHGVWLHVDACWGGSAIMSKKWRHLMSGCELADSIAWNPHKMLGAPLQASLFVTGHKDLLQECNSASASYLFQKDKFYDVSYDTGDKSIQCGRKTDAFKLWFMLRARGEEYFDRVVDNAFQQSRYLSKLVRSRPGFRPAFELEESGCTNVCFHFVPPSLKGSKDEEGSGSEEWWGKVSEVPPKIKERMIRKGSLMVGYQPLPSRGLGNFFRMVIPALPPPTKEDMEFVVEEIERCGQDL